jgi:hypothetical protein
MGGRYNKTFWFYRTFMIKGINIWHNHLQISVTQHNKLNLKNQYTSTCAPLVQTNGGPWGSPNIQSGIGIPVACMRPLTPKKNICLVLKHLKYMGVSV